MTAYSERSELVEASVWPGFVLDVVRYASEHARQAVPVQVPRVLRTSREAIRAMRAHIHGAHLFGMTPREVEQAVERAESGWMTALGLLNSSTPCGFTVVLESGAVTEWSVRPVRCLGLARSPVPTSPTQLLP